MSFASCARFAVVASIPFAILACSSAPEPSASSAEAVVQDPGQSGATVRVRARPRFGGVFPGDTSCWDLDDDYEVTYANKAIPFGARVFVHYGAEDGVNCSDCTPTVSYSPWSNVADAEMTASAPWEWRVRLNVRNGGGSAGEWTEALDFAVHVVMADGSEIWDNGGRSAFGYYRADIGPVGAPAGAQCPRPDFKDVGVGRVFK